MRHGIMRRNAKERTLYRFYVTQPSRILLFFILCRWSHNFRYVLLSVSQCHIRWFIFGFFLFLSQWPFNPWRSQYSGINFFLVIAFHGFFLFLSFSLAFGLSRFSRYLLLSFLSHTFSVNSFFFNGSTSTVQYQYSVAVH